MAKEGDITVNLNFLRSGAEFVDAARGKGGADHEPRSARERLEEFYRTTLHAAREVVDEDVLSQPDFISRVRAQRLARKSKDDGDEREDKDEADSESSTLHQFFVDTVGAARRASRDPSAVASPELSSSPPSIVNLSFLRTGAEFSSGLSEDEVATEDIPTHHEKLEKFFVTTLKAAAKAAGRRSVAEEEATGLPPAEVIRRVREQKHAAAQSSEAMPVGTPPTVVNLDFLRTGLEFKPPPLRTDHDDDDDDERVLSKHERLERFYNATLEAAQKAADRERARTKPSVVNLDFLRSGMEFEPPPFSDEGLGERPRAGTNQRLEEFYNATLAAAGKVSQEGLLSSSPKS